MAEEEKKIKPRVPRREISTTVEFIVDSTDETASAVDISEAGMSFVTKKPVRFRMRLKQDGELKEYLALLVWAKKDASDATTYGFQFIPDDNECIL
ncbi:MAG TPA: PilZ domain-containing protein [Smithellaceae bacterium]|nr:PilZ domain-containing protein [Smithellaceae bacterium]